MLKKSMLIITLSFFFACKNNKKLKSEKEENISDTIVTRKIHSNNEVDYYVKKSTLKYSFVKRNDQALVIKRSLNISISNLTEIENDFSFDEFKYVLKSAKKDFKIDSLKYIIYGTLDSTNDINLVVDITKKYYTHNPKKANINVEDYFKISQIILHSKIVKDINKSLSPFLKIVSKIEIEKAHIFKSNRTSSEVINCFVIMTIKNKQ